MFCFFLTVINNVVQAGQADYYTNLINKGKYHIVCNISSNFNRNDGQDSETTQDIVLMEDKEKDVAYFSRYVHSGNYYIFAELLEYKNQLYARCYYSRKELDINEEKKKTLQKINESHNSYWSYFGTPRASAIGTIFSCLGEISEKNGILKNYKTEFVKSGSFEQDGERYNYDEYLITAPEKGKLQLQYQNGNLICGIKLLNDKEVNHPLLFSNKMKEDRMEAVMFEKFDDDTDIFIKALSARIK